MKTREPSIGGKQDILKHRKYSRKINQGLLQKPVQQFGMF